MDANEPGLGKAPFSSGGRAPDDTDRSGTHMQGTRWCNYARLAWMAYVLGLAGCAHQQQTPTSAAKPPINLSGYSLAFKEGFAAGCDTAKGQRRRDERRFSDEAQYARGWEDGRSICAKR